MIDGIVGGISNTCAALICHPIDVIKVNYQTDIKTKRSIPTIIKTIWTQQGVKGFYRGIVPQLSTYPFFWAFYHTTNNTFNLKLFNNQFYDKISNSLLSASISSSITNPLFVIKNNMQTVVNQNVITTIKILYGQNGINSFYRGLPATLMNNTKLAIQFPLSDYLHNNKKYNIGTSAFISKILTTSLFYPFDLIRVNQRNISGLTIINAIKMIYYNGSNCNNYKVIYGIKSFYRGVLIYNCVSTPAFVLMEIFRNNAMNYINKK
jgi:hypothetical protein